MYTTETTKHFPTYELCLKMKELGFNFRTDHVYILNKEEEGILRKELLMRQDSYNPELIIPAPTVPEMCGVLADALIKLKEKEII